MLLIEAWGGQLGSCISDTPPPDTTIFHPPEWAVELNELCLHVHFTIAGIDPGNQE